MTRRAFNYVLDKITPVLETRNIDMAILSSGSPLNIEILLAATLRYLAGGNFIDIVDLYQLPPTCAHNYFWKFISKVIDNIKLPKE